MIKEILFAGSGGQGIMLMGKILVYGAIPEGLEVSFYPSYGPEMRGGTANCTVVVSDERIGSPVKSSYALVVAMNQASIDKFSEKIQSNGVLAYESHLVPIKLKDITYLPIQASKLANEIGTAQIANMVALGGILPALQVISMESILAGLERVVPAHRQNMLDLNQKAIEKGYQSASCQAIKGNCYDQK